MNLAKESVNHMAPQFMNHGISSINAFNKIARMWIPATRIIRLVDFTNWSMAYHTIGKESAVGDAVGKNQTILKKTIKLILNFG